MDTSEDSQSKRGKKRKLDEDELEEKGRSGHVIAFHSPSDPTGKFFIDRAFDISQREIKWKKRFKAFQEGKEEPQDVFNILQHSDYEIVDLEFYEYLPMKKREANEYLNDYVSHWKDIFYGRTWEKLEVETKEYPPPHFEDNKCMWPGCGKIFKNNSYKQSCHWRSHTGEKPFLCPVKGCGKRFSQFGHIQIHEKRKHTNEKLHSCTFQGCKKTFYTNGELKSHKRTHTGQKPFNCKFKNCNKSFSQSYSLTIHIRRHKGQKEYNCIFEECEKKFTNKADLKRHIRSHTKEKPFTCTFEGCSKQFSTSTQLNVHKRTHTFEKFYTCHFKGCGKQFYQLSNLQTHERTHTGERPFCCHFQSCNQRFAQQSNLVAHEKRIHTPEGQARQKKKENRMHLALKERGIVLDYGNQGKNPNQRISFSCIGGTHAELDFLVQHPQVLMIPECQEEQHSHYALSCEVKRWTSIYAALRASGEERNVCFYLFNPDSYTVDGVKQSKLKYKEKMDSVVNYLTNPAKLPTKPFTIVFFFYDVMTFPGTKHRYPVILNDPDFPKELKECVQCVY